VVGAGAAAGGGGGGAFAQKRINLKTTQILCLVTRMRNGSNNVKIANKFFENIRSPNNLE